MDKDLIELQAFITAWTGHFVFEESIERMKSWQVSGTNEIIGRYKIEINVCIEAEEPKP